MRYISTRGDKNKYSSAEAIKQGLAGDGGLFMPDEIPVISEAQLRDICGFDYPGRAASILSLFLSDCYSYNELLADCRTAYSGKNFPGGAAQVTKLGDNIRVLELWHGPTAAFKDMALQIMPKLFSKALVKTGDKRTALILVATSGDTGKAALEGYRDTDGIKIMVFYPVNGVSRVQKLQMATQEGNNVFVHSVEGNFDDTQNGVKKIFSDRGIAASLSEKGCFLSSANSINWGRLVPQIVYYVSAYCDLVNSGDISFGEEINVCVPTGNFGNILAAYLAKAMGLPIHSLICASNRNNILTDFFESGIYDRNRRFYTTSSPSMDILISSNLERLLYLVCGSEETERYMRSLASCGKYEVEKSNYRRISRDFYGDFCDEKQTAETIRQTFGEYDYLCDTHTAVGICCAKRYAENIDTHRKILAVSTASPYKFSPKVYTALTGVTLENELDAIDALCRLTGVMIPGPLENIADRKIRFDPVDSIKAEEMADKVLGL